MIIIPAQREEELFLLNELLCVTLVLQGIVLEGIEDRREVTLTGVGQQHHNLLALVQWQQRGLHRR